jgi:hypothetical protein
VSRILIGIARLRKELWAKVPAAKAMLDWAEKNIHQVRWISIGGKDHVDYPHGDSPPEHTWRLN